MTEHWQCLGGHEGDGPLPSSCCPLCGRALLAAPSDGTLVRASGSSPPLVESPSTHDDTLQRSPAALAPTPHKPAHGPEPGPATVPRSTTISGYEILGTLGRGGMGVVYKARQVGLNRIVALKMVLSGSHATPEELARFRTEAEAVARLQHPGIVQIHEIGEREGRPYISLEFCEGGSLQQKLDGSPFTPVAAAGLVEALARAVEFAHTRGIIHRDLKPANILLTAEGAPKVTDFGLAKLVESDSGHTSTHAILGTPMYMAPEQAQGHTRDVGPLADVYSLGAILYDLLTGRPPFRGTTALDTLQMVQLVEPIPPSRLQPTIPRDLQTICLKCLEKDPARRYGSAAALAADLRAYLDHRPISARPGGTLDRTWKWVRRHPGWALAAALGLLAPVVITSVSVSFSMALAARNRDLDEANTTLENQAARLETQKGDLERQKFQLEQLVETLNDREKRLARSLTDLRASNQSLTEALDRVTRAERDAQDSFLTALEAAEDLLTLARKELRRPGVELIRQSLLRQALAMCQRFTARPGNHPVAMLRAARAHRLVADLQAALGKSDLAVTHFDASLQMYESLIGRGDEARVAGIDYQVEFLETCLQYWGVLESQDPAAADQLLERTERKLSQLGARRQDPAVRRLWGLWHVNRAVQLHLRGQAVAARQHYTQALSELKPLLHVPEVQVETARLHVNRAALLTSGSERLAGQDSGTPSSDWLREARQDCETAIALLEKRVQDAEDATSATLLGQAYTNLGLILALTRENELARQTYRHAVELFEGLSRKAPLNVEYRQLLALAQGNLGAHLVRLRQPEQARLHLEAARTTLEELVRSFRQAPAYRLDLARLATTEGLAHVAAGNLASAEKPLTEALRLLDELTRLYPGRTEVREYLLIALRNLLFYHDRQARLAEQRRDRRTASRHVAQLVTLRQHYERALPALGAQASLGARLARFWERLLLRAELAGTLRAQAGVLLASADHQGAARCVQELRPLLAGDWPGWIDSAALLVRCMDLASEDRTLSVAERQRLARSYGREALELLAQVQRSRPEVVLPRLEARDFDLLRNQFRDEYQKLRERPAHPEQPPRKP
ncbi:MAG: protein kinase [Gemmataceae bacterium]